MNWHFYSLTEKILTKITKLNQYPNFMYVTGSQKEIFFSFNSVEMLSLTCEEEKEAVLYASG